MVEHVPRPYAQRLRGVEMEVGVRRLEARQPQQALVHQRQHIAHLLAVLFPDLYRDLRLRSDRFGHVDHRIELRGGVFDVEPDHAEQPYRRIVVRMVMGLDERHRGVDVGSHSGFDRYLERGLFVGAVDPETFPYDAAALDAHQRPRFRRRGDRDLRLVARRIFLLVLGHGESGGCVRHRGDVAPPVGGRYANDLSRSVFMARTGHADHIIAVIACAPAHRDLPRAVGQGRLQCLVAGVERIFRITGLRVRRGVPPPVGGDLVDRDEHLFPAGQGTSLRIEHDDAQQVLLFAVEVFVAPVARLGRHSDSEIGVVGRHGDDLLIDAEIAALFEDLYREFAAQHAGAEPLQRSESVGRQLQRSLLVRGAGDDLPLLGFEIFCRVVERVLLITLETRRNLPELRLKRHLCAVRRSAVQPFGRQAARELSGVDPLAVTEPHVDFHSVGLDGVHADRFFEYRAAQTYARQPLSGRRRRRRSEFERVDAVRGAVADQRLHQLPVGVEELHGRRMVFRQRIVGRDDEGEEDVVSGPPYAALAEQKTLRAFGVGGAPDVEIAQ